MYIRFTKLSNKIEKGVKARDMGVMGSIWLYGFLESESMNNLHFSQNQRLRLIEIKSRKK